MQLNIIADFVWRVDVDNCNVYKIGVSTSLICYDVEKTSYHPTYHHTVSRLDLEVNRKILIIISAWYIPKRC
jgi:hypothetical protein